MFWACEDWVVLWVRTDEVKVQLEGYGWAWC